MSRIQLVLGLGLACLVALALAGLLAPAEVSGPAARAGALAGDAPRGALARGPEPRERSASAPGGGAGGPAKAREPGLGADASLALELGADELGGAVCDAAGAALTGVPVEVVFGPGGPLAGLATQSDGAGRFRLAAPLRDGLHGPFVLRVGGRRWPALHLQAWPGRSVVARLLKGAVVEGRLVDELGQPLSGRVLGRSGDWSEEVEAGPEGGFRFSSAPEGMLDFAARPDPASGALPARSEAVVRVAAAPVRIQIVCLRGQTLRGRVLGPVPPAGAALLIWPAEGSVSEGRRARSGPDGGFELRGLPAGELWLTARGEGVSAGPLAVLVPLGADPDDVELSLSPDRPLLRGEVLGPEGAPIARAALRLDGPEGGVEATSGPGGVFAFPPAPAGEYRLRVEAAGFVGADEVLQCHPDGPPLLVELTPAARISGRVLTPAGRPLAGARVEARWSRELATTSDAEGRYALGGLPPGPLQVRVSAPGFGSGAEDVFLAPGAPQTLDLLLVEAAQLSGQVFDGSGAPLAGALVRVAGPADEALAQSDAQGAFRLEGLGVGPYRIQASRSGYGLAERDYVGPGERVELYLEARVPVTGVVRSLEGEPVHAVLVAPADQPEQAQLFPGSRFALVVGAETRQLLIRARSGPAHHGHGPGFLSPLYVDVPAGGGALQVELAAGAEAEGRVLGPTGEPVPGVAFLAGRQAEELLGGESAQAFLLALSEDGGAFDVPGLPAAGLEVTLSHPEFAPRVVQLRPGEGQVLQLGWGAQLSGVTYDGAGQPQGGVPLVVGGPTIRRLTSDAAGRYRAVGLARGRYRVIRYDTQVEREVELAEGQRAEVDLR